MSNLESGRLHLKRGAGEPMARAPSAPAGRTRTFFPRPIGVQQVLELLDAAFGAARPGSWGRAVPSPLCWQELAVYAVMPQGIYRYDVPRHRFELVKPDDFRAATADEFIAAAPLSLVYVADFDQMQQAHAEEHGVYAGADTGLVVEEVCNCCVRARLDSVVHGRIDRARLAQVLGLKPTERILLVQGVGFPAPEAVP